MVGGLLVHARRRRTCRRRRPAGRARRRTPPPSARRTCGRPRARLHGSTSISAVASPGSAAASSRAMRSCTCTARWRRCAAGHDAVGRRVAGEQHERRPRSARRGGSRRPRLSDSTSSIVSSTAPTSARTLDQHVLERRQQVERGGAAALAREVRVRGQARRDGLDRAPRQAERHHAGRVARRGSGTRAAPTARSAARSARTAGSSPCGAAWKSTPTSSDHDVESSASRRVMIVRDSDSSMSVSSRRRGGALAGAAEQAVDHREDERQVEGEDRVRAERLAARGCPSAPAPAATR